ncbi:hypothetical protein ACFLPY_000215 [Salmonella enterica]
MSICCNFFISNSGPHTSSLLCRKNVQIFG